MRRKGRGLLVRTCVCACAFVCVCVCLYAKMQVSVPICINVYMWEETYPHTRKWCIFLNSKSPEIFSGLNKLPKILILNSVTRQEPSKLFPPKRSAYTFLAGNSFLACVPSERNRVKKSVYNLLYLMFLFSSEECLEVAWTWVFKCDVKAR